MRFRITTKYKELDAVHFSPHSGIDLSTPTGTILRSPVDTIVEKVVDYGDTNIGKGVILQDRSGKELIYGHLSDNSQVHVGQHLHEGDILGISGSSGRSTGPHLHFGMKEDGHFIDPTSMIEKVDSHTGKDYLTGPLSHFLPSGTSTGVIPWMFGWSADAIKEYSREVAFNIMIGVGEAVRDLLTSSTLVGAGVCILLKTLGWRDGGRWASILIGVNIISKFLLGGI